MDKKPFFSTVREEKGTVYNPITNRLKIRSCLLYINFEILFSVKLVDFIVFSGLTSIKDI